MPEGAEGLVYLSYGVSALVNIVFAVLWIVVGIRCAMTSHQRVAGLFIGGGCLALVTLVVGFVLPMLTARFGGVAQIVSYNAMTNLGTTTLFAIHSSLIVAGVFGLIAKKDR